jgi:hypothetical protein
VKGKKTDSHHGGRGGREGNTKEGQTGGKRRLGAEAGNGNANLTLESLYSCFSSVPSTSSVVSVSFEHRLTALT